MQPGVQRAAAGAETVCDGAGGVVAGNGREGH